MKAISLFLLTIAITIAFNYRIIRAQKEDEGNVSTSTSAPSPLSLSRLFFRSRPIEDVTKSPLYPNNVWVPYGLTFTCHERAPGYYADSSPSSRCQAYHLCMPDGRRYTMLCGIGTVFNQRTFVCDHWYSYNCADAERDSELNNELWEDFLLPASSKKELSSSESQSKGIDDEVEGNEDEEYF